MRIRLARWTLIIAMATVFAAPGQPASAPKPDKKIEVQLLWGTDSATSPNKNHKQVAPDVQQRLKTLPLRFSHYFLVTNMTLSVPRGKSAKAPISQKCAIEVRDLGQHNVEVSYFGKDKKVEKRTQALPRGEMLLYGGNAPGTNAWLVVLKRLD